jgi:dTDP-4-dehydrorhamnose 3,5-epimerase
MRTAAQRKKTVARASQRTRPRGFIPGCRQDRPSVLPDWTPLQPFIDGVQVKEVRSVLRHGGLLTEVFRRDWGLDEAPVDQVFQVVLTPGAISAWHVHFETLDRLFVNDGIVRIVLYDARRGSPSSGVVSEYLFGLPRPALVTIPPGVWHGLQNVWHAPSRVLNVVDRAYSYEAPDHWRLPVDDPRIPYRFRTSW